MTLGVSDIPSPPYIVNGTGQEPSPTDIELKTAEELELMRKAGRLARRTLNMLGEKVKVRILLFDFISAYSTRLTLPRWQISDR